MQHYQQASGATMMRGAWAVGGDCFGGGVVESDGGV